MRISEYYALRRTQPTLDFVDVDVVEDTAAYVNPRSILLVQSEWGDRCVSLIQGFFQTVIRAIGAGHNDRAQQLLRALSEPNETHLGVSSGPSRGRALGEKLATEVWAALVRSEATRSGLLRDLEDSILMIEGIGEDITSDIVTNIIREVLITYTQEACRHYGIRLERDVDSGPLWNAREQRWHSKFVELPVTDYGKLLLVPKAIIRLRMDYRQDEYYRHYLLEYIREDELARTSDLVQLLKNGRRRVTKKDLIERYGKSKPDIVRETLRFPQALDDYRDEKNRNIRPPLTHEGLAEIEGTEPPNWAVLLNAVRSLRPGRDDASAYEQAIEQFLTALFYPVLSNPRPQHEIHEGRKRVDITYTNLATSGFFSWVSQHYPAGHVFVECKNYGREVGNPELDQIAGRFSPSRGKIGLLICRDFQDKELFLRRCLDTAQDDRGYVLALDDSDLEALIEGLDPERSFDLLKSRFDRLIMGG